MIYRRIYYIKKDFQKRFIFKYITLVFIGAVISTGMFYTLLYKGINQAFYTAHVRISTTGDVVQSPLLLTGIVVVPAAIIAILTFTLFNSSKIGSHLHTLAEGIEGLKKGDLTVYVNDSREEEFSELNRTFNEAVRQLNNKISSVKDNITGMEDAASNLDIDRNNAVKHLIAQIESLESNLSTFKLKH